MELDHLQPEPNRFLNWLEKLAAGALAVGAAMSQSMGVRDAFAQKDQLSRHAPNLPPQRTAIE